MQNMVYNMSNNMQIICKICIICKQFVSMQNMQTPKKACFPASNAGKKLNEEYQEIN